ncbi:MAG: LysR substrate-binding domain-containing protein [Halofilum sp. (in: g-proteobacteria)]|nr:LysR substrate-binding domain-containing protein [Halofilum sp. (in: g-proteobacteria)]
MTLTELRYIVAVARERHFGRAANACHVSQPTLSVAVRKLEAELGVTLFERGKSEIGITPVGQRLVEQARRVLAETATLRQLAEQAQDPLSGPLRVGAIHTVGPYLFPHLIPALHARAPHMPLIVEENYTARLGERLRQGELDAIIVALPFEIAGVEVRPLYDEPFRVVVPRGHAWLARARIDAGELAGENVLLLGAGHCFRDQVLSACPDCAGDVITEPGPERALEGSSLETIRHMVASGMGVTVLPCTAVGFDRYSDTLLAARSFSAPEPRRRVALAWRRSFPRPEAVAELARAIGDCELGCIEPLAQAEAS